MNLDPDPDPNLRFTIYKKVPVNSYISSLRRLPLLKECHLRIAFLWKIFASLNSDPDTLT